ncbi:CotH kinase family protein [Ruminiclostridium cellobioparum]|uniref:CotH kinase family protein n=1 Tax=Ruminiclostridium cellobioparum TaxID=29355 RepID=UPI000481162A|nr:CotH kinase family protein [Ruminiclostridium cellobioparum]
MITGRKINIIIISLVILAVIFTGILAAVPKVAGNAETAVSAPDYAGGVFDKDKITAIDIQVDEDDWQNMLDNATKEEYISCNLTINGQTITAVGIRPKGNSSLKTVASSDSDRYSFKFEFDHYIEGQTFMGLDKMVINNVQSDATYMKDYLSYDLMTYIGVKSPLFAYSNVTVNGKDWGLYIAVEAIEESFAQRNYGSDYGMIYKPESMEMGGGGDWDNNAGQRPAPAARQNNNGENTGNVMQNVPQQQNTQEQNPLQQERQPGQQQDTQQRNMGRGMFGGSGGGTDLVYTDDEIDSYSNIFDNEVFNGSAADYNRVVKALKNLNSGTDIEKYIDVDATLRYLAASTVVVNMDSYFSNMKHNYYLYEKDGKLTMLPWDYNLAFGGFQMGSAEAAVNLAIDTPVSGVEMSERPMLAKLLEVEEYKDKYHEYLKQIVDEYFNSGYFEKTVDSVNALISEYVSKDATAFYTHEQYTEAVAMLKEFGTLRAQSIEGQLNGTIPSTTAGQSGAGGKLVDASAINLSIMGSQGGGGDRGGMNRQDRDKNNSSTQNAQPPGSSKTGDQQQNAQQGNQILPDNQQSGNEQDEMVQLPEGMQLPDGFQPPGDGQLPEGAQPPDGMQQGADGPGGGNWGMGGPGQGGFGINGPAGQQAAGGQSGGYNIVIIAGSAVFLMGGLGFAMKFKRNKYI